MPGRAVAVAQAERERDRLGSREGEHAVALGRAGLVSVELGLFGSGRAVDLEQATRREQLGEGLLGGEVGRQAAHVDGARVVRLEALGGPLALAAALRATRGGGRAGGRLLGGAGAGGLGPVGPERRGLSLRDLLRARARVGRVGLGLRHAQRLLRGVEERAQAGHLAQLEPGGHALRPHARHPVELAREHGCLQVAHAERPLGAPVRALVVPLRARPRGRRVRGVRRPRERLRHLGHVRGRQPRSHALAPHEPRAGERGRVHGPLVRIGRVVEVVPALCSYMAVRHAFWAPTPGPRPRAQT